MAFNFAHDVALPTSAGEPVGFLIYPQAETTDGRLDSLDPDSFKYEINSRETTDPKRRRLDRSDVRPLGRLMLVAISYLGPRGRPGAAAF